MGALERFEERVTEAIAELLDATREEQQPVKAGSRALAFAVEAGFQPCMAYSLRTTAVYTGVPESVLRDEVEAGRLYAVMPEGRERGVMVPVDAVDEWMRGGGAA